MLSRNADVFSKHKADIGCCNFVEHEIEIEEGSVPHREGARRMTPHKSEACRKEIELLVEYDMIEPSKSPWACGVVMAKIVKTWTDMGFDSLNLIPTNIRLAASNQGAIYVTGRTPIISLQLGGRHLCMSFLVVKNLD